MTKETALEAIRATMDKVKANANPLWHDVGGHRRGVGHFQTGTLQRILMLEPFVTEVATWKVAHDLARNAAGSSQTLVPYTILEAIEKALTEVTDGGK